MDTRFDMPKAIATWREFQVRRHRFLGEDLDELEVHLRAHIMELRSQGWLEETAFREAVRALGNLEEARAEYRKVHWRKLKRKHKLTDELRWRGSMLKSYFKVALRTLSRPKRCPMPKGRRSWLCCSTKRALQLGNLFCSIGV